MATLDASFERDLKQTVLDKAEDHAEDIGDAFKDAAEDNFREYAARNDYDISHIWRDAEMQTERRGDLVRIAIQYPGLTGLFEWGVSPHVINGNPLLHFYWDAIDQWVTTESVNWGSQTGGIPESRAIRGALTYLRFQMQDGSITL